MYQYEYILLVIKATYTYDHDPYQKNKKKTYHHDQICVGMS